MSTQVSVDVDMLEQLPAKTLLKLVELNQNAKKFFAAFQTTVSQFGPLFRRLEELDIDIKFCLSSGDINLSFTGDGDRLGEVWGELRRNGYNTTERPKKGDTMFYAWWRQEGYATLWLSFTSSVCRRVQVGTKTVEQPIYETICGEMPELEPSTQPTLTVIDGGANDIPF